MKYINDAKDLPEQVVNNRIMYDQKGNVTDVEPLSVAHVLNQSFTDGRESRTYYLNTISSGKDHFCNIFSSENSCITT